MGFEFDGKEYEKASPHQRQWGKKVISELELKGNERILDLGCGDGGLTALLAEIVADGKMVGIDASKQMIEYAQREHKGDNVEFLVMDINDINFDDEFDIVFSNATLNWVKGHERLLKNVYKALKKGGLLRFQFAGDGNCSNLNKVLKEVMAESKFTAAFAGFEWPWYMPSIKEYKGVFEKSDFDGFKVWEENADRYFENADVMTKWIEQPCIVPFLEYIGDEASKKDFRDAVVSRMIEQTQQEDGRYFETFRRVNVFAKK